jgi:hypothetical protein
MPLAPHVIDTKKYTYMPLSGTQGMSIKSDGIPGIFSKRKEQQHYSTAGTGSAICRKTHLCSIPNMHPMESTHSAPMLA